MKTDANVNLTINSILEAKKLLDRNDQSEEISTEKIEDDKKPIDETEAAAYFIHEAHQEFRRLAFALADRKRHAVSRVLEAVLFEPLEKTELLGKHEQELFAICQQVMYNKGIVLQYAFNRAELKKQGEKNEQSKV